VDVPLAISLPPDTPPGDYPVEIELPHERRDAVFRVEPRYELSVRPARVVVAAGSSAITVSVTNTGNVVTPLAPLTTSKDGEIRLALGKTPLLAPGSAADIEAEVTVDDQLDPHRRHEFDVPIGTADVVFVVLPRAERRRTSANRNQDA
jgi:uncharacterized membrane protein